MDNFLSGSKKRRASFRDEGSRAGSRFAPCPVCERQVALALMNDHLDSMCGGGSTNPTNSVSERPSPQLIKDTHPTETSTATPADRTPPWVKDEITITRKCIDPFKMMADAQKLPVSKSTEEECTMDMSGQGPVGKAHRELRGLYLIEDFISIEEEVMIVNFLDNGNKQQKWKHGNVNGPSLNKSWGIVADRSARKFRPPEFPMPPELEPFVERMRRVVGVPPLCNFRPNECNAISYERDKGHRIDAHCDDRQLSGEVM